MPELETEILIALHNIEDRLQEIVEILRMGYSQTNEESQKKVLSGSPLRKSIHELSDGSKSVSDIAKALGKSIQQTSNNIAILQKAGLIKEIRKGKEKCYLKTR